MPSLYPFPFLIIFKSCVTIKCRYPCIQSLEFLFCTPGIHSLPLEQHPVVIRSYLGDMTIFQLTSAWAGVHASVIYLGFCIYTDRSRSFAAHFYASAQVIQESRAGDTEVLYSTLLGQCLCRCHIWTGVQMLKESYAAHLWAGVQVPYLGWRPAAKESFTAHFWAGVHASVIYLGLCNRSYLL